ncbi:MAG: sigma-54-dependent Fis family transcriptional regulator [Methylotenera sp.]|nr:sigma-54-dependent Fis family transcriptional regulator [Oligoflexia bacterium]
MSRLLVVDDEKSICSTIEAALKVSGHEVEVADSGEMAITLMRRQVPDIVLTDLRMDGMSGLDLLNKTREHFPSASVVIMTAYGTIDTAVSAMKNGAYDYLVKPFTPEQLDHLIERIQEYRRLKDENHKLKDTVDVLIEPSAIVTSNPKMQKLLDTARKVAVTDSTILVTGESGTGKTLLAKMMHDESIRNKGPFAVVNCATLSENLLESELFGHIRGAFTGAVKDKLGRLQVADTGTVFLDEIGEISPNLQTKLLRFLQDREFEKVGDTKTIKVDVRIIAATNKDLEREVREGRFREDLYFRLNVIELHMPSLRQRPEDLVALSDQLLARSFMAMGRKPRTLDDSAKRAIQSYGWPGNIRELKNALERAAILSAGDFVTLEDLPDRVLEHTSPQLMGDSPMAVTQSDVSLEDLEKKHIQHVLATTRTLEEAASVLGINLSTLWRKRRRYNLE